MSKLIKYCIYGSGGCGRSVMPILREKIKDNNSLYFIDDFKNQKYCNGVKLISLKKIIKLNYNLVIYIAISSSVIRRDIVKKNKIYFRKFNNLISNRSIIFDDVTLGRGNIISPFCTLGSNTKIGNFNHINLYSYIEHDCTLGNYVTISPGVKCNGNVIIEDEVFIGSGAIIGNGTEKKPIVIGKGSVIGAGSIILKNIPRFSKVIAHPSKRIPNKEN